MRSKFTTIRFKPDISTINFEQLDEMNEPVTTPEIMETNSLTEIGNSKQPSSLLLAKSGNYRPFSVEEIPDEGEFEELFIFRKKKLPGQRNKERKKARILKKGEKCYDLSPRQKRFAADRLPKQPGQTSRWNVGTFDTLGTFRRV